LLDLADGLDEIDGIAVVLFDSRSNGEDVGIKDDILGWEVCLFGEEPVGPPSNPNFVFHGNGLTFFVKHHDDHGRAQTANASCPFQKRSLALLKADGIHDRLALETLQPNFEN
jgi:hypothetical protein